MSPVVPIVRLWLAVLCGYLALGATLQELPGYLTGRFQAGPVVIGVTVGLAFAGTAAGRPLAGRAGDAGRSRTVGMAGGMLTSVAAAGHLMAPDLGLLLVARVAMGVGEALLFSGTLPWALSAVDRTRGGRTAGWYGLSMWGGLSVGPLLTVGTGALGGATAVWWLVIALPAASTALIASTRAPRASIKAPARLGRRALVPAGATGPGAILGLAGYGYGTLTALLVLFLGTGGLGGQSLGLVVLSATFLLTRATGSPLVDRYGGLKTARRMLLIETAGLALLAISPSETAALVATSVTGAGLGVIYPATSKLTLTRVAPTAIGAAMGSMTSCWDLGILVAGSAGGLITAAAGYRSAFWVAALAALASFTLAAVMPGRRAYRRRRVLVPAVHSRSGEPNRMRLPSGSTCEPSRSL